MNETGDSGIEGNNFCDCPKGTLREFLWEYDHCRYAFYQAEDDLKQAEKRFKKHLSIHEDQEKLGKTIFFFIASHFIIYKKSTRSSS